MSKPIRILHVVGTMNRGGAETLIMELYRHIDRTKVQFDFLVYNYTDNAGEFDDEILSLGGKIYTAKKRLYKNPIAFYRELHSFFKSHSEYKIVHSHQFTTSGFIVSAAKSASNYITISHSHAIKCKTKFLRTICAVIGKYFVKKNSDYIFGCSQEAIKALIDTNPDNRTSFVLNNAIDFEKFNFSATARYDWRAKLNISYNDFTVGYVARFLPVKNHVFLIKIFTEILKQKPNSVLILVGDGPLRSECEKLTIQLGINDKVKFLGVRSDVNNIINVFDCFVMPSISEGLGIALVEAQANGLPCVMSKDVIPAEADIGAGLVTCVSLDESPQKWATECLNVGQRKASEEVKKAIIKSGYDINAVSSWLQDFYIKHWK